MDNSRELRRVRAILEETQSEFARRFKVTRFTLSRWENGAQPPWWVGDLLKQIRREAERGHVRRA